MTHRGPFQPVPCWDSVILFPHRGASGVRLCGAGGLGHARDAQPRSAGGTRWVAAAPGSDGLAGPAAQAGALVAARAELSPGPGLQRVSLPAVHGHGSRAAVSPADGEGGLSPSFARSGDLPPAAPRHLPDEQQALPGGEAPRAAASEAEPFTWSSRSGQGLRSRGDLPAAPRFPLRLCCSPWGECSLLGSELSRWS